MNLRHRPCVNLCCWYRGSPSSVLYKSLSLVPHKHLPSLLGVITNLLVWLGYTLRANHAATHLEGRGGMGSISKTYKSPFSGGVRSHIIATPDPTSHANPLTTPYLQLPITSMHPPVRTTRSSNNPGVIDLPRSRRSSANVAAEKLEGKKTAAANAKKKQERAAQVARVEDEIRMAQKEAVHSLGEGSKKRVKKTFPRETPARDSAEEVSASPLLPITLKYLTHLHFPRLHTPNLP